jgi:hypothetical protein
VAGFIKIPYGTPGMEDYKITLEMAPRKEKGGGRGRGKGH